jgi:hypothetical protein
MKGLWLFLAALLVLADGVAPAHPFVSDSARDIFQHWQDLASSQNNVIASRVARMSSEEILRVALKIVVPKACMYLFMYRADTASLEFWPKGNPEGCGMPTALDR